MAFQQITTQEIEQGKPIDSNLLLKIKENDDTFNSSDVSHNNTLSVLSSIVNLTDDALVGSTIYTIKNVAPRGYIPAMGGSIGKASGTYVGPDYYNLYISLWEISNASAGQPYVLSAAKGVSADADWTAGKTIKIDESGLFARASGGKAGTVGAKQDDAFQGHWHSAYGNNSTAGGSSAISPGTGGVSSNLLWSGTVQNPANDGTNGPPRTSNETRPVNIAKYVFIRYSNKLIP